MTIKNPRVGIKLLTISCNKEEAADEIRVIGVINSAKLIFFISALFDFNMNSNNIFLTQLVRVVRRWFLIYLYAYKTPMYATVNITNNQKNWMVLTGFSN
jgi:hypothetical protein